MSNKLSELNATYLEAKAGRESLSSQILKTKVGTIRGLFMENFQKEIYKSLRDNLKMHYKKSEEKAKDARSRIEAACRFGFIKSTEFLASVVSLIEGKDYIAEPLSIAEERRTIRPVLKRQTIPFGVGITGEEEKDIVISRYALIATPEDIRKIKERNFYATPDDFAATYVAINQFSNVLVPYKENLQRMHNLVDPNTIKVPTYLTGSFPYLEGIIMDLVNDKLENPIMSDEELYGRRLSYVSENIGEIRTLAKKQ